MNDSWSLFLSEPFPVSINPVCAASTSRGQYFEAYPDHGAEYEKQLDDVTRARWLYLAAKLGAASEEPTKAKTRGDFIHAAYTHYNIPRRRSR